MRITPPDTSYPNFALPRTPSTSPAISKRFHDGKVHNASTEALMPQVSTLPKVNIPTESNWDKPETPSQEARFKHQLTATDPLLHGLWRYIGYSDDLYESSIGTLASAMAHQNRHQATLAKYLGAKHLAPKHLSTQEALLSQDLKGIDMQSSYAHYLSQLKPEQVKTLSYLNTAIYGLCNLYCIGDSLLTGYRGYKSIKSQAQENKANLGGFQPLISGEQGDKRVNRYALAKGVQLTLGQYFFHYLASYTLPALVIRDIIYKNVKFMARLGAKLLPPAISKHATTVDMSISVGATLVSIASMPLVAKYLDPFCEKVAEDCFYKPTNKIIRRFFPSQTAKHEY